MGAKEANLTGHINRINEKHLIEIGGLGAAKEEEERKQGRKMKEGERIWCCVVVSELRVCVWERTLNWIYIYISQSPT